MAVALMILGTLLGILSWIGLIWLVVEAFRGDVRDGWLCLCVPLYVLYFAFTRFENPRRRSILALWLGPGLSGGTLFLMGLGMLFR